VRRWIIAVLLGLAAAAPAHAAKLVQVGSFDMPVSVAGIPRDDHRLYVVEQAGVIRELFDGAQRPAPFLDIRSKVLSGGERGLLSMAFDPQDLTQVYVYYTSRPSGDIQIDRYTAPTPDGADVATRTPILTIPHRPDSNHNGGQLQFGPDGKLYAGTGDGGGADDQHHNAQNLTVTDADSNPLLGKLLRMERDGSAPADNPFGAPADRVWSLGLRNPWRFTFDRETGALVIGDVGQGASEEIDYATSLAAAKGANYGWNLREGMHNATGSDPTGPNCCTEPVIEHGHSAGWLAIIGGYVVRDPSLPELAGRYVYGDNAKGDIYAATLSPAGATDVGPTGLHVSGLTGFGEDGAGRIYAAAIGGPVYRLVTTNPAPGPDTTPPKLTLSVAARQHFLRSKRFSLRITCDEQCRLVVSAKGLKTRHVTARAGAKLRVVLRPSAAARRGWARALRRHHKVVIRVRVRATDAAGNATTRRARVHVVR
jgi:glucose/arabinose dehydrogenase